MSSSNALEHYLSQDVPQSNHLFFLQIEDAKTAGKATTECCIKEDTRPSLRKGILATYIHEPPHAARA
jgi:hypothetical protein